jgi:lysophospholipase L1-like esterase
MPSWRRAWWLGLVLSAGCRCAAGGGAPQQLPSAAASAEVVAGTAVAEASGTAAPRASDRNDPAMGRLPGASAAPASAGGSATRPSSEPEPRRTNCQAPSLEIREPLDGRDSSALSPCRDLRREMGGSGQGCGERGGAPALDLARLEASVLALDDATVVHVRALAQLGRTLGRNPKAFGLVGDSMTVSYDFMRPLSVDRPGRMEIAPELLRTLGLPTTSGGAGTIVDYYRGAPAERVGAKWRDAYAARRAAKVGARSPWAIVGDAEERSPLADMVRAVSPEIVVVAYGGNDAAYRVAPPEQLARDFEQEFARVLDAIERRGIVPIVSTIARHGDQGGRPDCERAAGEMSNWRLAVQTNAINAAVAQLACRRHVPLVDLRYALDGLPGRGLANDGVHPTAYRAGAGMLTREGMACGYNVRNYLTLRALREVKAALGSN